MSENLHPCKVCKAKARIRYRLPVWWVECRKKCGNRTGYFSDWETQQDPKSRQAAIDKWNKENAECKNSKSV